MPTDQHDWIGALAALREAGTPCALVTVTGVVGSAPRDVGTRMLVTAERLAFGTIGGGRLEHLAMERARELLTAGRPASETLRLPLAERAGQCCGGEVTLLLEAWAWSRPAVAVFGAGHVGQALGGLAPWMGAEVRLVDTRDEQTLEPRLPGDRPFEVTFTDAPEAELDELPDSACVLIMTHDHGLDLELVAAALRRPFPYLGLIGSERKWQRFRGRLLQRGLAEDQLARVRCPIGGTRTSKEPGVIALGAAAEVLETLQPAVPPAAS